MDLFLAVPRPTKLDSCNPKLLEVLGVEQFELRGQKLIGKKTTSTVGVEQLENCASHLSSILRRLQVDETPIALYTSCDL